jgi:predicted Zn-dependent protease
MRRACATVFVIAVMGCEAMRPAPAPTPLRAAPEPAPAPPAAPAAPPAAEILRVSAQQATPEDPLVRVAECLARGDSCAAVRHLEAYVAANPGQHLFRFHLAELCGKCDRTTDARRHYEAFVCAAEGAALWPQVVTAHIKLMTLAEQAGDRFAETHHRGAGLLLLVKGQDGAADRDPAFCEELTCKALRALQEAKELKPTDPRTRALLAEAYERVGGRRAAGAERAAARGDVVGRGEKVLE